MATVATRRVWRAVGKVSFTAVTGWSLMTKREQYEAYEETSRRWAKTARAIEAGLDEALKAEGCSMRARVEVRLIPDPNDDPRLP